MLKFVLGPTIVWISQPNWYYPSDTRTPLTSDLSYKRIFWPEDSIGDIQNGTYQYQHAVWYLNYGYYCKLYKLVQIQRIWINLKRVAFSILSRFFEKTFFIHTYLISSFFILPLKSLEYGYAPALNCS